MFAGGADFRSRVTWTAVALFPLCLLTLRGWTNGFLALLLLIALTQAGDLMAPRHWRSLEGYSRALVITLASAILAVLAGQALRGHWVAHAFDAPSRLLLAIPVFLLLKHHRIDFSRVFQYACPLSVLLTALAIQFFARDWSGRVSTYFVDPITLGNYSLVMGFLCLFSLDLYGRDARWLRILKLAGFAAGLYISLTCQSRSGWVAAPVLFALWLWIHRGPPGKWLRLALAAIAVAAMATAYYGLEAVHTRIDEGIANVIAWVRGGDRYTSIGLRLDMWRIAFTLFLENPVAGYGDEGYRQLLETHPYITGLTTPEARRVMGSGLHNDIAASAIRSGIFGLVSTLSLFLVPLFIFWRHLRSPLPRVHGAAALGLCFVTGLLICSFGEQVLYLTFMSSFYGLMMAALCATLLWTPEQS